MTITLTVAEAQIVLDGLQELPYRVSAALIGRFIMESSKQFENEVPEGYPKAPKRPKT